ncbi:Hypothetical predicted protein [Mytilus galloprovincialis]|uniref:Protein brambleberry n=2 Tax=Mytilus galloprovincialis TaxID=29158 RepID=A0A8B6BJN4_MYTGA|nr:Hypothetical predicted protein [Mytilus galloprovincialis]
MILRGVFFFSSLTVLLFFIVLVEVKFTNLDKSKFHAGKTEFELMQSKSEFPNYGYCWKETIIVLTKDCKQLTAEVQGKLALAYLNCFLQMQNLPIYECDVTQKLSECTQNMKDSDRNSMATFFTHTQNICYFLESQVWHDETERTIKRLATSSEDVATQLEETSELQNEMLHQQKESMTNQQEILEKSVNLSNIISTSSDNIHKIFDEYKNATNEQRLLIGDLFDKFSHLQSMMLGEFTGLYSILYYAVMVLMSYFLTSAPRTAAARFWLFGVATVNILSERFAISWLISEENQLAGSGGDIDEAVYMYQKLCRKISGAVALLVLGISAYCYQDLHVINNQLLWDIKRKIENLEIKNTGLGNQNQEIGRTLSTDTSSDTILQEYNSNTDRPNTLTAAADTTGYESDSGCSESSLSTESLSGDTDNTYIPSSLSTVESYSTCYSWESSQTTLTDELRDIRGATPLKEIAEQIDAWAKTGKYRQPSPIRSMESRFADQTGSRVTRSITPQPSTSKNSFSQKYFLRQRSPKPLPYNQTVYFESPGSFAKTVKSLEKITRKNSLLTRNNIKEQKRSPVCDK